MGRIKSLPGPSNRFQILLLSVLLIAQPIVGQVSRSRIGAFILEEDEEGSEVLNRAVKQAGDKFTVGIHHLKSDDVLGASKAICQEVRSGVIALIGPHDAELDDALASLAKAHQLPYISTAPNARPRGQRWVGLHPAPEEIARSTAALAHSLEWDEGAPVGLLTDDDYSGAVGDVGLLIAALGERNIRTVLPPLSLLADDDDPEANQYKLAFASLRGDGTRNFVVDVDEDGVIPLLQAAQATGMVTDEHAFIFTLLDMQALNWTMMKYAPADVYGFDAVRRQVFDEKAGDAGGDAGHMEETLEAALLVDAIGILNQSIAALGTIVLPPQRDCDDVISAGAWPQGYALASALRDTTYTEGASGPISFDEDGQRENAHWDICELDFNDEESERGVESIGKWLGDDEEGDDDDDGLQIETSELSDADDVEEHDDGPRRWIVASILDPPFLMLDEDDEENGDTSKTDDDDDDDDEDEKEKGEDVDEDENNGNGNGADNGDNDGDKGEDDDAKDDADEKENEGGEDKDDNDDDNEKHDDADDDKDKALVGRPLSHFHGYIPDLLNLLEEELDENEGDEDDDDEDDKQDSEERDEDATIRIVIPSDKRFGQWHPKTRRWDGMMGQLVRGEVDIIASSLGMTADRARDVDFTPPFMTTSLTLLYKEGSAVTDREGGDTPLALARILSPWAWLVVLGAFFVVAIVLLLIRHLTPPPPHDALPPDDTPALPAIADCFWLPAATLILRGSDSSFKSHPVRLALLGWWLFALLLLVCYAALVQRSVTEDREPEEPPESLEQLLSRESELQLGLVRGGSTMKLIKESEHDAHHRLWQRVRSSEAPYLTSYAEGIERVKEDPTGRFAFLMEESGALNALVDDCQLKTIGKVAPRLFALALSKGSDMHDELSTALLKLAANGKLQTLEDKWWPTRDCDGEDDDDAITAPYALGPIHLAGPLVLLLLFLTAALTTAFIEKCIHTRNATPSAAAKPRA